MWEPGIQKKKIPEDVNAKMLALEGELTDEQAQATLAEFLYANPGFTLQIMGGINLFPFQELMLKGWMTNDYSMAIWSRGLSKSYLCAIFCLLWSLFNPNSRIVIVSMAFKSSRRILEQIEKFVNDTDGALLKNCFSKDMQRRGDEWKWVLPNGASIMAVPLGDGKKLRGIRADVLVVDERNYISNSILNEVVGPFLVSNNNIKAERDITDREDQAIKDGTMTEEERTKFESNIKVIYLSSAGYQFEDMYPQFCKWVDNITGKRKSLEEEVDKDFNINARYFVSRIGYDAAPPGLMNAKTIEEAQNGQMSESVFNREYRAIFTPDSDGYFSAQKMAVCTIPNGKTPCIELTGDRSASYILAIDPSFSSAEYSDYFAMMVLRIVDKKEKKVPMVVHNYMVAGGNMQDHHIYLLFLLKKFNIVYLAIDSSQGDNEFITSANNSKLFKDEKLELVALDADFKKDVHSEISKEIRASYNLSGHKIVQKQPFGTSFQKAANEFLQTSIDYQNVFFASKLAAHEDEGTKAVDTDLSMIKEHEFYKDMSPNQFVEHQDMLMDMVKQQCALIELTTSVLGGHSWDLPQVFRRSKNPSRIRKDGYSALLLGVWATKLYLESQDLPIDDTEGTFTPFSA